MRGATTAHAYYKPIVPKFFPPPEVCPDCGGKLQGHGTRKRHVIEQGQKVWYTIRRLCCSACGKTLTLLRTNMLPRKHYAAAAIEEVLQKQEDPNTPPLECTAKESTLYRWCREFPILLRVLLFRLSSLTGVAVSLVSEEKPLQMLYKMLEELPQPPPVRDRLAWAFFLGKAHPVCL